MSRFPHYIRVDEVDRTPPREIRTWAQRAIIERRSALRKQVTIMRLRQQGLSQHEAEEQYGDRLWRAKP